MESKKEIQKGFEENFAQMTADLQGLIAIRSVAGEAAGDYPFGAEVQRALTYMLELGSSMGFAVKNVDNYGGHIDFPGSGEEMMAVVGHLDIVPEGKGWSCDPFAGVVRDGWIYGRGVQDDKGPTIVSLYAMKILKDQGFQPKKTVRLILGLDEETNWESIKYYLEKEKTPDFGIVPDADFPLIQCEKGLFQFGLVRAHGKGSCNAGGGVEAMANGGGSGQEFLCLGVLERLQGGSASNVVADQAELCIVGEEAALEKSKALIGQRADTLGYLVETNIEGEKLIITVKGKAAHAAFPERGENAVSLAMNLVSSFTFANEEANVLNRFYAEHIGLTTDGSKIGCGLADDLSGKLTFNVGRIRFDGTETRITVDVRYPVTFSKEAVWAGLESSVTVHGFRIEEEDHIQAIYLESNHPVVVTLMEIYREISGDHESQPAAIGGATFARAIPNCLAFGPLFPGDPELEHQKDERIQLSQLMKAGLIYAEAIRRLAGS